MTIPSQPQRLVAGYDTDTDIALVLGPAAGRGTVALPGASIIGADWRSGLRAVGAAFGRSEPAEAFIAEFEGRVPAVRERLEERFGPGRFAMIASYEPGSFNIQPADNLTLTVLAQDLGRPLAEITPAEFDETAYSGEQLGRLDEVDLLLLVTEPDDTGGRDLGPLADLQANPLWQRLPALAAGQVFEVDASSTSPHPSPLTPHPSPLRPTSTTPSGSSSRSPIGPARHPSQLPGGSDARSARPAPHRRHPPGVPRPARRRRPAHRLHHRHRPARRTGRGAEADKNVAALTTSPGWRSVPAVARARSSTSTSKRPSETTASPGSGPPSTTSPPSSPDPRP